MTRTIERGVCGKCGEPVWMYHGTEGDFPVHSHANAATLSHLATFEVPDVVAEVADERRKEYASIVVIDVPDDDVLYDQDNWHPEGMA